MVRKAVSCIVTYQIVRMQACHMNGAMPYYRITEARLFERMRVLDGVSMFIQSCFY